MTKPGPSWSLSGLSLSSSVPMWHPTETVNVSYCVDQSPVFTLLKRVPKYTIDLHVYPNSPVLGTGQRWGGKALYGILH